MTHFAHLIFFTQESTSQGPCNRTTETEFSTH